MTAKKYPVALACCALVLVQAVVLYLFGRNAVYPYASFKVWDGSVRTPENSQQLFDWYSSIHLVYGIIGYYLSRLANKKWAIPLLIGLLLTVALSSGWEIYENTPYFIHQYDTQEAGGYYGDSIVNSVADTACVALGFWMAFALPVWLVVALALALEVLSNLIVHDGVILSTFVFFKPLASMLDIVRSP